MGPLIILGLCMILTVFFYSGKGAFLIAGFNTLPKEEKEKYDRVALCKFMGNVTLLASLSIALSLVGDKFDFQWLVTISTILYLGFIVFALIYVNTGNRFKK